MEPFDSMAEFARLLMAHEASGCSPVTRPALIEFVSTLVEDNHESARLLGMSGSREAQHLTQIRELELDVQRLKRDPYG